MKRILNKQVSQHKGEKVKVAGWVNIIRSHGKIVFCDLRDMSGILQMVCLQKDQEVCQTAKELRPEWVVEIEGTVNERPDNMKNSDLPTGDVELLVEKINILNKAKTIPFEINQNTGKVHEETRLKYRYLDLRSERMKNNLKARDNAYLFIRNYLKEQDFTEVQTPILSKSTPEGARDFLVPSRHHQGKFFALPQSPQQYKQLLMVAGLERYFQIAPCFRDEDPRADRAAGEFYQLDLEMSFVAQEDILQLTENLFTKMVKKLFPEKHFTQTPWPRLTYQEVMEKYNSDKPDLRKDKKDPNELAFAWIVDFPLFTPQEKDDFFYGSGQAKFAPSHHMFTAPKEEDLDLLDKDPLKVKSYQHDMVLNGYEVGGGSIRIHDPAVQEKIFDLIGFTEKQKQQFSHLLEAFQYGAPPHGGIAPGLDRLLMVLNNQTSLRENIAFPLTGDARDPLTGAPTEVTKEQLQELGIKVIKKD